MSDRRQKILNFAGEIIEQAQVIKMQPGGQRYTTADKIAKLARLIRIELDKEQLDEGANN